MLYLSSIVIFLTLFIQQSTAGRPSEAERVRQWYARGNTWPPSWYNESQTFRNTQTAREIEIMTQIPGADERWENWMQFTQYQLVPTFTPKGFDIIKTPPHVHQALRQAVMDAVEDFEGIPPEGDVGAIYGPYTPKFVDIGQLTWDTINEVQELHEEWSGLELKPTSSYGVRLYLNGSSLAMHCDKVHTHVISSIIHIAHEYDDDDEPWPIQIEDHDGVMYHVALQEGEMLFYESASCLHGRIKPLKGKYYGSLFVHYQPVDRDIWAYTVEDIISNVPPHWNDGVVEDHGSRWAGQAITVDSVVAAGAPPRYLGVDPDTRDPKSGRPAYTEEDETGDL